MRERKQVEEDEMEDERGGTENIDKEKVWPRAKCDRERFNDEGRVDSSYLLKR